MRKYSITATDAPAPLCGQVDGTCWSQSAEIAIDQYPWYTDGHKQGTVARVMYDKSAIYFQFICEDRHIFSQVQELNGLVCRDSCVEFFASIDLANGPDYFNFEVNCCGVFHMGFGPGRQGRKPISPELARRIQVVTSMPGPIKPESPDDRQWWLAVAIPFDVLSEFTGKTINPKPGDIWRGNFYRCGGKTDDQYAAWSPINTPNPDFHSPEFFGKLSFE